MKRIISVVLSVILVFCLCGCDALFGRASDPVKPHLIEYRQKENNPIRPINSDKIESGVFATDNSEDALSLQLAELFDIVVINERRPSFKDTNLDERVEKVYKESINILNRYILNDFSDFERVHAIHDYLTSQVVYDEELYIEYLSGKEVSAEDDSFLLSGPILNKNAVCDGFTKAFAFLCAIEGIRTENIEGSFFDGQNTIPHIWNKVRLNNKWYNIDVTMDNITFYPDRGDPITVVHHGYFLLSDKSLTGFGGHRFSGGMLGYVSNEDYPYFESAEAFFGSGSGFAAQVNSKDELTAIFDFMDKSKRKYGQVELRLNLGLSDEQVLLNDAYSEEIREAYKKVSGKDFSYIPERDMLPFQKYPRGVFVFLVYK